VFVHLKPPKAPRPTIDSELATALGALFQAARSSDAAGSADVTVPLEAKDLNDHCEQIQRLAAITMISDLQSFIVITGRPANQPSGAPACPEPAGPGQNSEA
jgi:hypothetical protein